MKSDWTVVRTFLDHIEADLAISALEAAGIESAVRADDCGGVFARPWSGGVELLVAPADLALAEDILSNSAIEPAHDDAGHA